MATFTTPFFLVSRDGPSGGAPLRQRSMIWRRGARPSSYTLECSVLALANAAQHAVALADITSPTTHFHPLPMQSRQRRAHVHFSCRFSQPWIRRCAPMRVLPHAQTCVGSESALDPWWYMTQYSVIERDEQDPVIEWCCGVIESVLPRPNSFYCSL